MNFLKGYWNLIIDDVIYTGTRFECEQNSPETISCTYLRKSNVDGEIEWNAIYKYPDISWDGTEFISEKCLRGSVIKLTENQRGLIWYRPNVKTTEWRKRKLFISCFQSTLLFKIDLYQKHVCFYRT